MRLPIFWKAKFADGAEIAQFEKADHEVKENLFQKVKDRFQDLEEFYLLCNSGRVFGVNLKVGYIFCGKEQLPPEVEIQKQNIRLIYFIRNRVVFNSCGVQDSHVRVWHLGFQYNDEYGRNHQRIIKINQFGDFIIN